MQPSKGEEMGDKRGERERDETSTRTPAKSDDIILRFRATFESVTARAGDTILSSRATRKNCH